MIRQFVSRLSESLSAHSSNLLSSYGCVTTLIAICAGLMFWSSVSNWLRRMARHMKIAASLPGPPALPIIGNALQFACHPHDLLERLVDLCSGYDTVFRVWLGPQLVFVTTNPRDYEIILGSSKASHKAPMYRFMEPLIGMSLVSNSGPVHKAHRKIIMPFLNTKTMGVFAECFDRQARICADILEKKVGAGEFDIHPYMIDCTVHMTMETIMGTSIETESNDFKEFIHWTERVYELIHERIMKAWLFIDQVYWLTPMGKRMRKGSEFIHTLVEDVIVRKKQEHYLASRATEEPERPRVMVLEQLIAHVEKTNDMNDIEIRDEIYTVFTAAQDTTATLCGFACLLLAMHPEAQDKVRAEVKEVVGNGAIDEQHLARLKYLDMVIRENIRLHPVAPVLARTLTADLEIDNCTLPEGGLVAMIPFLTHRDPKYWKEPEKFIPERFLPENSEGRHPFATIPYSGGIRGCVGQKFSIMLMKNVIAHIVRRYRLSTTTTMETLRIKTDISIRAREGFKLSLTKVE